MHHMCHVGVSPTVVHRGVEDQPQDPAAWDFCAKTFKISTGIPIGLPKDLTFKTV